MKIEVPFEFGQTCYTIEEFWNNNPNGMRTWETTGHHILSGIRYRYGENITVEFETGPDQPLGNVFTSAEEAKKECVERNKLYY